MRFAHLDTAIEPSESVLVTQIRTSTGKMEVMMSVDARAALRQIGSGMDAGQSVRVKDGGYVILDPNPVVTSVLEYDNEQRKGPRRPAAGSRKWAPRGQGAAGRSRKAGAEPRVRSLAAAYQQQLTDVREAYPDACLSQDENGSWLSVRSGILPEIGRKAIFFVALPNRSDVEPRAWAFWEQDGEFEWIGDRHTNFFDGSICAYSPADGVWKAGDDLRTLLDLYSVWALRHLHLAVFGCWAGRQYALLDRNGVPLPYYRLVEFKAEELCSCNSGKTYGGCCRPLDLRYDFVSAKRQFEALNGGRSIKDRRPPHAVISHCFENAGLPKIIDVHDLLRAKLSSP